MLEFLRALTPEQQAAVVGLMVAALMYAARHVSPRLFASQEAAAKFQRTAAAVLLSGLGVLLQTLGAGDWSGAGAFVLAWALAYATAEGAHTVVSRTTALGQ